MLEIWLGSVWAQAQSQSAGDGVAVVGVTNFKHVLLPIIMDRNPYLSEATRQVGPSFYTLCYCLWFHPLSLLVLNGANNIRWADGKLLALPFQAAATTAAFATKFGADITVVGKCVARFWIEHHLHLPQ